MVSEKTPPWTIDDVWAHVEKSDDPNGCWLWRGPTNHGTPMVFKYIWFGACEQKNCTAARILWAEQRGAPGGDAHLRRTCSQRLCVNPAHRETRPRLCRVCKHPKREIIDAILRDRPESFSDLARRLRDVTANQLVRHASHLAGGRPPHKAIRSAANDPEVRISRATDWLRNLLVERHLVAYRQVVSLARAAGLSKHHIGRARLRLGVVRQRVGKGVGSFSYLRLPPDEERAAEERRRQELDRVRRLGMPKVYTDQYELECTIWFRLERRGQRWTDTRQIVAWFGIQNRPMVVAALAKLVEHDPEIESHTVVKSDGKTLTSYRRKATGALVEAARRFRGSDDDVIVGQFDHDQQQYTESQIATHANLLEAALARLGGQALKNVLHNRLGSSQRGSPRLERLALDKLVAEGRIIRERVGRTEQYTLIQAGCGPSTGCSSTGTRTSAKSEAVE